jgi:hypothetical protein
MSSEPLSADELADVRKHLVQQVICRPVSTSLAAYCHCLITAVEPFPVDVARVLDDVGQDMLYWHQVNFQVPVLRVFLLDPEGTVVDASWSRQELDRVLEALGD